MAKLIDPKDLISLRRAAELHGMNPEYLRQLIVKGMLEGWQVDDYFYVTTRKAMQAYLKNRRPRGRPARK